MEGSDGHPAWWVGTPNNSEPSGSIISTIFLDHLSKYQLLKDSDPRHKLYLQTLSSMTTNHITTVVQSYSGRKITPSLGYVAVRGEGKMERATGSKTAKRLSEHV
jgi:hypothetical protein